MKKRTITVPKKFLASFGSGTPVQEWDEDDDLEFFDVEEESKTTVVTYGKFPKPQECSGKFSCMWCWAPAQPDDRGRYGRTRCPNCSRLGVTQLKMSVVKTVYIENDDE